MWAKSARASVAVTREGDAIKINGADQHLTNDKVKST